MTQYFPKPYEPFGGYINVKVDLSNYATKADIKNISHVDTSSFALKTNLANLKTKIDKLDINKLVPVPVDLSKRSDVIKNDVIKKTDYNAKITKMYYKILDYKIYYGIGFDRRSSFSFPGGEFGQNIIVFGVDMNSSIHVDSKGKDILILGKEPTQEFGEHSLTAQKMYSINFTVTKKKLCLRLHYNGSNSYLFVNGTEIYKFKAKHSEIVASPLCLRNISKKWTTDNMKRTGFTGYVYDFSMDYDEIAVDDTKNINKYLMNKNNIV